MKNTIFIILIILLAGCSQPGKNSTETQDTSKIQKANKNTDTLHTTMSAVIENGEKLIYQNGSFKSYTEEKKRGEGVVSINLDINDRLDIWDMDDSKFGELVLNEDQTYFTVNMPQKIVARKVIPEFDFAAFDFDAEQPDNDAKYLFIYINHEKRKVAKSDLKYNFRSHDQYQKETAETGAD